MMGAMPDDSTVAHVGWEEVVVSNEKGRREVYYYLKRSDGGRTMVVVGKEKNLRHMLYRYAFQDDKLLPSNLNLSSMLKLRSRREVVDWLNSILSGEQPNGSLTQFRGGMDSPTDDDIIKDVQMRKLDQYETDFRWLGSSWTCRKRRKHYQSFRRNGAVISAQDFVFVLAEEDKRLIAYLDDMYEDTRGNKMVVVRWFHKIDEVGFVLPPDYNDREIFFSLCLQDLSIECIDGLATVLSPEHYEKHIDEATHTGLMPFVCYRQFDNDDIKPFDITHIKGYWKQGLLRKTSSLHEPSQDDLKPKGSHGDAVGLRPNKRIRWSKECDLQLKLPERRVTSEASLQIRHCTPFDSKGGVESGSLKEGCSYISLSGQGSATPPKFQDNATPPKSQDNATPPNPLQYLSIGSQVEVLSQDSGIRGCWFRALIIKKHKDKVKVQYKDVKDAVDDSKNLEEWILASRLAAPDAIGIRLSGRTIVRPTLSIDKGRVPDVLNVGCVVDAWWHDGWWEGIVVKKESEDRQNVYFPGEKQEFMFSLGDLRHSKEWCDGQWHNIVERPDIASPFSGIDKKSAIDQNVVPSDIRDFAVPIHDDALRHTVIKTGISTADNDDKSANESQVVPDLSKDYSLACLRWKSSGKRRRSRSPVHKVHFGTNSSCFEVGLQTFEKFCVNSSLKFDTENCKYANDTHFSSSVVSTLTNLVMSR